jgi:hypothetical protein
MTWDPPIQIEPFNESPVTIRVEDVRLSFDWAPHMTSAGGGALYNATVKVTTEGMVLFSTEVIELQVPYNISEDEQRRRVIALAHLRFTQRLGELIDTVERLDRDR